jgi:hypothetical protein
LPIFNYFGRHGTLFLPRNYNHVGQVTIFKQSTNFDFLNLPRDFLRNQSLTESTDDSDGGLATNSSVGFGLNALPNLTLSTLEGTTAKPAACTSALQA